VPVTVLQAVLFLVVAPVLLYVLVAIAAAGPRVSRRPRYRVGQPWTFPPLWWTANPEGAQLPEPASQRTGERGGARGSW